MKYIKTFEKATLNPKSLRVYQHPLNDFAENLKLILEKIKNIDNRDDTKVYIQYNRNGSIKISYDDVKYFFSRVCILTINLYTNDEYLVNMRIKVNDKLDSKVTTNSNHFKNFIKTELSEYISKKIFTTVDSYDFILNQKNTLISKMNKVYDYFDLIANTNKFNL